MREAKDLFSKQAETYARYRPAYPQGLYNFLYSHLKTFNVAWDCAAGNGQATVELAKKFKLVCATDISIDLLKLAPEINNIKYSVERAEKTSFLNDTFDLVTVSTALHWFDHNAFFKEVTRVAKPGALFAAWAYAPFKSINGVDTVLKRYYTDIIGQYWDPERKYVDEQYRNIPIPFKEITVPSFSIETLWNREQFIGFLNSWSSTQNYINKHHVNPLTLIEEELNSVFPEGKKIKIVFPLFMRAGIVLK